MTDHKAEAERSLGSLHEWQAEEGITDQTMLTVALEAQIHATLYLAEQQRIANLIAYWHPEQPIHPISTDGYKAERDSHRRSIREGLGL